jgi:hypothetical protein
MDTEKFVFITYVYTLIYKKHFVHYVGTCMIYLPTKFRISDSNNSIIVIALNSDAKVKLSQERHVVILHSTKRNVLVRINMAGSQ